MNFDRGKGQNKSSLLVIGLTLLIYVPKILVFLILFIEDLSRLVEASIMSFVDENREQFFSPRRRFVSQIALGIATIPFASLLYGMTIGKYNFKVLRQQIFSTIYLKNLMVIKLLISLIYTVEVSKKKIK